MAVEVETPEDYAGNVMGDLSSRRGMVQGMDDMVGGGKGHQALKCRCRNVRLFPTLRSMSQGRATHDGIQALRGSPRNVRKPSWLHAPSNSRLRRCCRPVSLCGANQQHRADVKPNTRFRSLEKENGKEKLNDQAARQRGHRWSRGPRQDDADGGDHHRAGGQVWRRGQVPMTRSTRRPKKRRAASPSTPPTSIRDGQPPLRPRGLPRPRRLRQEHDHRCRPDGRRHPGRAPPLTARCPDPRAHPAGPPGRRALHHRVPEQVRHGRRRRLLDSSKWKCANCWSKYDFPGDDTPIIRGSAKLAMEGDKGPLGEGAIMKLADALDSYIPRPSARWTAPS